MYKNLAFQDPQPFEQLAVRLPNLICSSLCLISTLKSSLSFQLGVSRLVHSFINVVLGNQDAILTLLRVLHRSWMRRANFAGSLSILWVPHREATSMARETRAILSAGKYSIRWLGFSPKQDP